MSEFEYEYEYDYQEEEKDESSMEMEEVPPLRSIQLLEVRRNIEKKLNEEISESTNILIVEFLQLLEEPIRGIEVSIQDNNIFFIDVKMKIFDCDSQICMDMAILGLTSIDFQIQIKKDLYPYYPPTIILSGPRLLRNLIYHIPNLFFLRYENWNLTTSLRDIITEIHRVINRFGEVDKENPDNFSELEKLLLELSVVSNQRPYCTDNEDFITEKFYADRVGVGAGMKISSLITKSVESSTPATKWKKGTGYGGKGDSFNWTPEKVSQVQSERDLAIHHILHSIHHTIQQYIEIGFEERYFHILRASSLIRVMQTYISEDSFMSDDQPKVDICIDIMNLFTTHPILIQIMRDLYSTFDRVYQQFDKMGQNIMKVHSEEENSTIMVIYNKLVDIYRRIMEAHIEPLESSVSTKRFYGPVDEEKYHKYLSPLQYEDVERFRHYKYTSHLTGSLDRKGVTRICKEMLSLSTSLPCFRSSTIWVRTMDSNVRAVKALISGPDDTPYSCGLFEFDILFPNDYPQKPPTVNIITTGGGKVRFNPNLYACGKVCLSLLGTWHGGHQTEGWMPNHSTLLQVLMSISALILIDTPYFNEPGYQSSIGTDEGTSRSDEYNRALYPNTMQYAVLEMIRNPPPEFNDVIIRHFSLKREQILENSRKWNIDATLHSQLESTLASLPTFE